MVVTIKTQSPSPHLLRPGLELARDVNPLPGAAGQVVGVAHAHRHDAVAVEGPGVCVVLHRNRGDDKDDGVLLCWHIKESSKRQLT